MERVKDDFQTFCLGIPKLELHAHLNGSLSDETLRELHKLSDSGDDITWTRWETVIEHGEARTLEECFQIFDVAHSLTTSAEAIKVATRNTIKEFAEDGVVYLELRSTPREVAGVMSKAEYIQAVVDAIQESSTDIVVKLLLSVNRQHGKAFAEDTLRATLDAHRLFPSIVVGMDLSGNPSTGDIDDYLPLFSKARARGLKIAVHIAEIANGEEVLKILDFRPDRLGHATCIHPQNGGTEEIWQNLLKSQIPIELCLTSNVKCRTVNSYKDHHFKDLFSAGHPITLATDDKGVFATSLSHEYQQAAEHFSLSKEQLWELSIKSIDFIFGSDEDKVRLLEIFQRKSDERYHVL